MSTYSIKLNNDLLENQTIEDIFHLRLSPLLVILVSNTDNKSFSELNYLQFAKLKGVDEVIQSLELNDSVARLSIDNSDKPIGTNKSNESNSNSLKESNEINSKSLTKLHYSAISSQYTNKQRSDNNMSPFEFLKFAATLIKSFSGENPSQLAPFLTNVSLIQSVATTESLPFLVSFLKGRLEGRASRVCADCGTVEEIILSLKKNIKFDSSAVVESRLAALQLSDSSLTEFAKSLEQLADNLHESLVLEGVSVNKANEMTIDSVRKNCRKQTKSTVVKSVLASCSFENPKDVVSKFLTEVAEADREYQILTLRKGRGNNRNSDSRPNYRSNNYSQGPSNASNNNNNGTPPNRTNNFNTGTFRGRSNNYPGQRRSNIRMTQAGNDSLPTDRPVGEMESQEEEE